MGQEEKTSAIQNPASEQRWVPRNRPSNLARTNSTWFSWTTREAFVLRFPLLCSALGGHVGGRTVRQSSNKCKIHDRRWTGSTSPTPIHNPSCTPVIIPGIYMSTYLTNNWFWNIIGVVKLVLKIQRIGQKIIGSWQIPSWKFDGSLRFLRGFLIFELFFPKELELAILWFWKILKEPGFTVLKKLKEPPNTGFNPQQFVGC